MKMPNLLKKVILAVVLVCIACFVYLVLVTFIPLIPTKTTDARKAYCYWARGQPPADMEVLIGEYRGSAVRFFHENGEWWTYLKLKPSQEWWNQLVKKRKLMQVKDWHFDNHDIPGWFKPSETSICYHDYRCLYFRDPLTGICYISEWCI